MEVGSVAKVDAQAPRHDFPVEGENTLILIYGSPKSVVPHAWATVERDAAA